MMLTRDEARKVAATKIALAVVDRLFKNGAGDRAERLVLESPDGRNLGGWCRGAVRDVIAAAILGRPTP